ncbi:MAG: hypothetical protein WC789_06020 [Lentisphaeria bacterium]|jgi:hypothetical protein
MAALRSMPGGRIPGGVAAPNAGGWRRLAGATLILLALVAGALLLGRHLAARRRGTPAPPPAVTAPLGREQWFTGEIPAPRGRILDRYGRPLAWSTRHFTLAWTVPADARAAEEEAAVLQSWLPRAKLPPELVPGQRLRIQAGLTSGEVEQAHRLRSGMVGLEVESQVRRQRLSLPAVAALVGEVRILPDGREVGVSGLEKEWDARLRGQPGRFKVMVGRDGRWRKETWQKLREMEPGYDVYVPAPVPPPAAAPVPAAGAGPG